MCTEFAAGYHDGGVVTRASNLTGHPPPIVSSIKCQKPTVGKSSLSRCRYAASATKTLPMFTLLVVGVVFTLALAVTLYAFASAKDGFEDRSGFHPTFQTPSRLGLPGDATKRPLSRWGAAN